MIHFAHARIYAHSIYDEVDVINDIIANIHKTFRFFVSSFFTFTVFIAAAAISLTIFRIATKKRWKRFWKWNGFMNV